MEIAELLKRCIRIIHISRKPTGLEYAKVAKTTAFGIFLLGLIGVIISFIFGLIR